MFTRWIIALALGLTSHNAMAFDQAVAIEMPEDVQNELLLLNETPSNDADAAIIQEQTGIEEPVTTNYLKIVGRGIQNRRTHDVIALACVGEPEANSVTPSCNRVRHIKYYAETQKTVYVGKTFSFDHEPTQKDLESYSKEVNKAVKKFKRASHSKRNFYIIAGGGSASVIGAFIIIGKIGATVGTAAAALPSVGIAVGMLGIVYFGSMLLTEPFFPKSGAISEALANQDGWNWSSRPRGISDRSFKWVERYLNQ